MRKKIFRIFSFILMTALLLPCLSTVTFAVEGDEETDKAEGENETITHVKGANVASETYIAGKYYRHLTSLPLTGDNVTDLLAVALSQLGYMESDSVDDMSGETGGSDNYTEFNYNMGDFGVGYGTGNYDWCASFVSYCLLQSRCTEQNKIADWCRKHMGDPEYIWREVGCPKWAENLETVGKYEHSQANGGDYTPKTGDLIFFRWAPNKAIGHIGIVVYCDGERVYTVEGNTSGGTTMVSNGGAVYFKNYAIDYSCIDGYGVMPYIENEEMSEIDYSGAHPTTGLYINAAEKAVYSEPSVESDYVTLPLYTMFEVIEVVEDGLGGMLKAICEIDGKVVEGYIVNSADERVIQLSTTVPRPEPISFLPFDESDGFVGGEVLGYRLDGEVVDENEIIEITESGIITLEGFFGYEKEIERVGYYLDGDREKITWIEDNCFVDPEEQMEQIAGEKVRKCAANAKLEDLSYAEHKITFVLELENGVIPIVGTLNFKVRRAPKQTEPPKPKPTEKPTDAPTEELSESESETLAVTQQSGCGAALGASAVSLVGAASAVALTLKKKKED